MEYFEIARVAFELLILVAAVTPTQRDDDFVDRVRNILRIIKVVR